MKDIKIKIWRAPFAKTVALYFNFGQGEWSGYSLQVLGLHPPERVQGCASLWAFRCYPCPERVVQSLALVQWK